MNIIFDLDGTLADCKWRRPLVENKPRDWDKFNLLSLDDKPNEAVLSVFKCLNREHQIYIVTGRMEKYRNLSRAWMSLHGIYAAGLFMRKNDDFRPDHIVKEEILNQMIKDKLNPSLAFDDRDSVVDMWRRNGIPCFQVDKWVETKYL